MLQIVQILVCLCCLGLASSAIAGDLIYAAENGTPAQVRAELQKKQHSQHDLNRALYIAACGSKHATVLQILIDAGADSNTRLTFKDVRDEGLDEQPEDVCRESMIWHMDVTDHNDIEKLKILLNAGMDIYNKNCLGETLLSTAVIENDYKRVDSLLRLGVNPNKAVDGYSLLETAVNNILNDYYSNYKAPKTGRQCEVCLKIIEALLDAGTKTNKEVFRLAKKANLPAALLQRLTPSGRTGEKDVSSNKPTPPPTLRDDSKIAEGYITKAVGHVKNKDCGKANGVLDTMEQRFSIPSLMRANVHYLRSLCAATPQEQLHYAASAKDLDTQNAANHRHYAALLIKNRRFAEALKSLNIVIGMTPRDTLAYSYRAICNMELGALHEAVADITQALEISPTGAGYFQRGELYYLQKKYALAEADFVRAAELGQRVRMARNYLYRAAIREHAGDAPSALWLCEQAQASATSNEETQAVRQCLDRLSTNRRMDPPPPVIAPRSEPIEPPRTPPVQDAVKKEPLRRNQQELLDVF